MITPTNTINDLKTQLNTYFEYLGENQYTRHIFAQMPCMDLRADKDEDMWKTTSMCFDLFVTITYDLCLGI